MIVVLTLNADPHWLQAVAQHTLPVVNTLSELTEITLPVIVAEPVNLEQITAIIPRSERVIVAYSAPERVLAKLLTEDASVVDASAQWAEDTLALLALHRQWRRKLVLVNLDQLASAEAPGLAFIAEQGWPLRHAPIIAPTDVYQLMAAQILLKPELQTIKQRLLASSLGVAEDAELAVETVLAQYRAEQNSLHQLSLVCKKLSAEQAKSEHTNKQLIQQLSVATHAQHELDALLQQQTKQLTVLRKEQVALQQAMLVAKTEHKQALMHAALEHKAVVEQLMQTQAALEIHYNAEQHLSEQNQTLLKQVDALKAEYLLAQQQGLQQQQIQQQRSFAELNALQLQLKQALDAKRRAEQNAKQQVIDLKVQFDDQLDAQLALYKQTKQENTLLLAELMNVQEMLEVSVLDQQQQQVANALLSDKNAALLAQYTGLLLQLEQQFTLLEKNKHQMIGVEKLQKRELLRVKKQLRQAKAKADEAEFALENLRQEWKTLHHSKVWKATAPVRALSRLLHKEDKTKKHLQRDIALIITSELFDSEWYVQAYPDVAQVNINPAEHYLRFGAAEGRRPSPDFDGEWYLKQNPDVAQTGINPLLHYVKFGRSEGRTASPKLLEDFSE